MAEVVVALLTPFRTGRALDEGALAKHVDFSVAVEYESSLLNTS